MKLPLKLAGRWLLDRNNEGKLVLKEIIVKSENTAKWDFIKRVSKSVNK